MTEFLTEFDSISSTRETVIYGYNFQQKILFKRRIINIFDSQDQHFLIEWLNCG